MTKIVINACYGGFSISDEGMHEYARLKGIKLYETTDKFSGFCKLFWTIPEDHPERIVYYTLENEKNQFNKTIKVVDNRFTTQIVKNFTNLMEQ